MVAMNSSAIVYDSYACIYTILVVDCNSNYLSLMDSETDQLKWLEREDIVFNQHEGYAFSSLFDNIFFNKWSNLLMTIFLFSFSFLYFQWYGAFSLSLSLSLPPPPPPPPPPPLLPCIVALASGENGHHV